MYRFHPRSIVYIWIALLALMLLACSQPLDQANKPGTFVDLPDAPPAELAHPAGPPTPTPSGAPQPDQHLRRVNMPYFSGAVAFEQAAVFWLGQETANTQYADIRVGYNNNEILVSANVIDRSLWYNNKSFDASGLTAFDSMSFYLDERGNTDTTLDGNAYRFDAQFSWYEKDRTRWQAAYEGNGANWNLVPSSFWTEANWRGTEPNGGHEDRGWIVTYHIPFAALGIAGPPPPGTIWGLAASLHNRNDVAGSPIADQVWPDQVRTDAPITWGQLRFGLMPPYVPPAASNLQSTLVKQGLNGQVVTTTNVGGYTLCGENLGDLKGVDWWNAWGVHNWAGQDYLNVMNQSDIADWACFNKIYANFPLDAVPPGKVIVYARLTFYQFGHAGEGDQKPGPSLIQVMSTDTSWDPKTINWNNAPWPNENGDRQWAGMGTCTNYKNCPSVTWDVSQMVVDAYAAGQPLRLILYDADSQISSGKYFFASETGDWNDSNRPVLQIVWGDAP